MFYFSIIFLFFSSIDVPTIEESSLLCINEKGLMLIDLTASVQRLPSTPG
ncbi:hypothetical protein M8C21_026498 [Ambrosia artemisiifolia]|uniref:Uncharacterized protein n=1 Tax=Ambrosia artemisiifolia TaxID=4212 RepID=A0AAD5C7M9_AMBAR|nr:hypothetical protein M8C21_026498 [Ambrosia artemisiifolia]